MKKLLLTVTACAGLLLGACSNDSGSNDITLTPDQVPATVMKAFNEAYPAARQVSWQRDNGFLVADFAPGNGRPGQMRAWFGHNGVWHITKTEITFEELPAAVKEAFAASEYATWTIDDVDMLTRRQGVSLYRIGVEQKVDGIKTEVDLFYSEDGVLTQTKTETETDYTDCIPDALPASIADYINATYPGARIVDVDAEHDGTEVKIIDGTVCRKLKFNARGQWLLTKTDVRPAALPEPIAAALQSEQYAGYRIDESEHYITPTDEYYTVELKGRHAELELCFSPDGTLRATQGHGHPDGGADSSVIDAFVTEHYPGAVIKDRDFEHGMYEVEIRHEGRDKDLLFTADFVWVSTEWEVRINELPQAVKDALAAAYPDSKIDEADYFESPESIYYIVELKKRHDERKVKVTPDGTIL